MTKRTFESTLDFSTAEPNDTVILSSRKSGNVSRTIGSIERVTAKQIIVAGDPARRFWRDGDHVGNEVGDASSGWHSSYLKTVWTVAYAKNESVLESVRAEMRARAKVEIERRSIEQTKKDAATARRAWRFEGDIEAASVALGRLYPDADESPVANAAATLSGQLHLIVLRIEDNERDLRRAAEHTRKRLDNLLSRLDADQNLWRWDDDEVSKLQKERESLHEQAKDALQIARPLIEAES